VIGSLQVTGEPVTSGYYQSPALNAEAFTADGWFQTGDLGMLRAGQLTITGREKDVIIINGINYYSHEIEASVEAVAGVEVSYTAACAVRDAGGDTDRLAIFFSPSAGGGNGLYPDEPKLLSHIRQQVLQQCGVNPAYLVPVDRGSSLRAPGAAQSPLVFRPAAGRFLRLRRNADAHRVPARGRDS
jgi:acyl-CoA synthetase (AMP-forming)/AMP-acid ligase II